MLADPPLALAVLDRASGYLTSTSQLAQRAPAELRSEMTAFEREAGIAKTAGAMSVTPPAVLKQSETVAELADRLMIAQHGDGFRLELRGQSEEGAAGLFKPAELQRVLQMLQGRGDQGRLDGRHRTSRKRRPHPPRDQAASQLSDAPAAAHTSPVRQ